MTAQDLVSSLVGEISVINKAYWGYHVVDTNHKIVVKNFKGN